MDTQFFVRPIYIFQYTSTTKKMAMPLISSSKHLLVYYYYTFCTNLTRLGDNTEICSLTGLRNNLSDWSTAFLFREVKHGIFKNSDHFSKFLIIIFRNPLNIMRTFCYIFRDVVQENVCLIKISNNRENLAYQTEETMPLNIRKERASQICLPGGAGTCSSIPVLAWTRSSWGDLAFVQVWEG